ncbi:aminotransferase class V-fold PLP-dependent enzyme [Pedomonas mirosovicensis]|uniref:aminotransferase class V-fold PLP-dependent enzyme n=1 Tax=Pedomonas mirosovicensis TaxID=2908641 RepID=UPI00216A3B6B|nr:cysteine desulfurase [Pedomonas mirosovicensis]MCH8683946.1 cysteine desulfurase [Pedomonas mirosovicensis]
MKNYRSDFPVLLGEPDLVYLDTAATAQKPKPVIDAITRAYGQDYATVHRGVYRRSQTMTESYEEARATVARFINANSSSEVVFVRGATEGINLVAHSWAAANLGEGDEVVLTELEHHSNIVPWQLASEIAGFGLRVIPMTETGDLDYEAAEKVIGPKTKLVAVTHISNVLGTQVDVKRIAAMAKAVDAKVLVDGCQAAPRTIVDVQDLGADFYVFSGHKLYGPTGIGVLWGRLDLLNSMRPYHGGGAMIETVTFARSTYLPAPQRFEAGTPHIVGALGLKTAIDYVTEVGLPDIQAHEAALTRQAREALSRFNSVKVLGPGHDTGIVSFVMEGVHPHDIGTILDEAGINIRAGHHCAQPLMERLNVGATARVSFGIYNTPADVDRLAAGMEKVVRIFR